MSKIPFLLVLAASCLHLGGCTPPFACAQAPATTARREEVLSAAQQRWMECLPVLLDAEHERAKLIGETEGRLRALAYKQVSIEGGQRFSEAVLGFDARLMDQYRLRAAVETHASTHIFSAEAMKAAERRECEQLQLALKRIDSNVLIKLGVDADLEAALASFPIKALDSTALDRVSNESVDTLARVVSQAQSQQNLNDFESGTVGYLASEAAEDAWRDENGDLSPAAWLGSTIVGVVVGNAASTIAEEVTGTQESLKRSAVAESVSLAEFYVEGTAYQARRRYWIDSALTHNAITAGLTGHAIGVEEVWAQAAHVEAAARRAEAAK